MLWLMKVLEELEGLKRTVGTYKFPFIFRPHNIIIGEDSFFKSDIGAECEKLLVLFLVLDK